MTAGRHDFTVNSLEAGLCVRPTVDRIEEFGE